MRNLILLAPTNAGKGVLSAMLVKKYGYIHISTGVLLRERRKQLDEIGKTIAEAQDSGALVPSDIVYRTFEEKFKQPECDNGFILDGFPRNVEQAEEYERILKRTNRDLGIVISLEVPKEILVRRGVGRRLCRECGADHNLDASPEFLPKVEGKCNKCGGELYQRADDNEETLGKRFDTHIKQTQPLVDYYSNKGILHTVNFVDKEAGFAEAEKLLSELGENLD